MVERIDAYWLKLNRAVSRSNFCHLAAVRSWAEMRGHPGPFAPEPSFSEFRRLYGGSPGTYLTILSFEFKSKAMLGPL